MYGMPPDQDAQISQAADALRRASSIAVLTGAGISAESGIPTFRDALTGLWENFRAEQLATPEAFLADPKLVWEWYAWRRQRVALARPNPGHLALTALANACSARGAGFTLITQNVDGLHQAAGSTDVIELHGNICRVKCFERQHVIEQFDDATGAVPSCPLCGSLLRPDVVWFGESLPEAALAHAMRAARDAEVFISVGTSTLVEPAASLPFLAVRSGAVVIEVNAGTTPLTAAARFSFRGQAGMLLPQLVEEC